MRSFAFGFAAVAAAALTLNSASAQTAGCTTGGPGGAFPVSGTGGGGVFPTTLPPSQFTSVLAVASVPAGATAVTEIKLNGMTHTWGADVQFVLTDPAGSKVNLWVQQGGSCDFSGDYVVVAPQVPPLAFPACTGTLIPTGAYQQNFGGWPSGTNGINNTSLSAIPPQVGNWTLEIYDWAGGDVGTLTSWEVCFGTPPPPPPPPPSPCNGTNLTTLFASNNNGGVGGQIFFDVNVTNPAGITLSQLDINTGAAGSGVVFGCDVYVTPNTYVGNNANSAAWTLAASGTGTGAGANLPSLVEFPDFLLPFGSHGISLVLSGAANFYTNGNGTNQVYSNADLILTAGAAQNAPWNGTIFTPRVFNGTLRYNCSTSTPIVTYCTAGTSTNGCNPAISASAQPSVTQANACLLSVANVEGQKSGLIFYGVNNTGFTPVSWAVGSSSFLCVKSPTQRMATQSSGGTNGLCNGSLTQDLNAFLSAFPGSLGQPFTAGQKLYAQAWYRDPPAAKTTNLSNAVELTFVP